MITTIHKCDRCGAEGEHMKMWRLEVSVMELATGQPQGFEVADPRAGHYPQADWCAACMREVFGWKHCGEHAKRKSTPRKGKPTIEELVREIAQRLYEETCKPAQEEVEE